MKLNMQNGKKKSLSILLWAIWEQGMDLIDTLAAHSTQQTEETLKEYACWIY